MATKGGITMGKSHKEGGIPMVVKSTGQKVELEGGEGVINKRNMASEKTYEFEGQEMTTCEIASEINEANGNGVQIDCDDVVGKKYKYDGGGNVNDGNGKYLDLFEYYDKMPTELSLLINSYDFDDMDYNDTETLLKEVNNLGYTFDYGLDNEPYGLRPIGVELNQLKGYEEYAKGGDVKNKKESVLNFI